MFFVLKLFEQRKAAGADSNEGAEWLGAVDVKRGAWRIAFCRRCRAVRMLEADAPGEPDGNFAIAFCVFFAPGFSNAKSTKRSKKEGQFFLDRFEGMWG